MPAAARSTSVMNVHDPALPVRHRIDPWPRALRWVVRDVIGTCPTCGPDVGQGRIYRTGSRSWTMQCTTCRLQWTVTFYRFAMAARSRATRYRGIHDRLETRVAAVSPDVAVEVLDGFDMGISLRFAAAIEVMADAIEEWAGVQHPEHRGRTPRLQLNAGEVA